MPTEERIMLDTSAVLAFRSDESGADIVEDLLTQAEKTNRPVLVSFMTRMELLCIIQRHEGELEARRALGMMDTFKIEWISCELEILERAAALKSRGGLSVSESWIAATAMEKDATLFHKDPELMRLSDLPQQFLLGET